MAEVIDVEKCNFQNFGGPVSDLDLGSGHTAYHCASVIDLSLHIKFHWNQKT